MADETKSYHMTAEEFRTWGRAAVDWVARYMEEVERYPVLSRVAPGQTYDALPEAAPEHGESFDAVLADLDRIIMPGITHWQSPSFFGYFPANASGPAILGELLCAGLGVQGMLWASSPACTELETRILDWLVPVLGLPAAFLSSGAGGGVIQDSASSAALCALVAARERATGQASNRAGIDRPLCCYASTETHSSVEKGVRIAGLGTDLLRRVLTDGAQRMLPDQLRSAIEQDLADGRTPCLVCATVGTTSTGAVDPVRAIGQICREHGVWLHVDAAMAGTAAVCPEHQEILDGVELADSFCFNPHKWMFTNFDCDCFWVADRGALVQALSILPEYLRNQATESGAVIDYRDWQIPLGRRFRALKLWLVLRHYGTRGLQHHVRQHIALAREVATWIERDERLELLAAPRLNLVCFRHSGGDSATRALLERLNASGKLLLTHTRVDDQLVLRLSIGQTWTGREHVEAAWRQIEALL